MSDREIDPTYLQGEALRLWYVRPRSTVEQERRSAYARRYEDFFGPHINPMVDNPLIRRNGGDLAEAGEFIQIGNPANPRLRREWERREGKDWPQDTAAGRKQDVAHTRAKADGGTDTVDNIRPMPRAEHHAEHVKNGDYARWARRAQIASAFGGKVARVLGPLSVLSHITGLLSGRIRTDSFDNFSSDIIGQPSLEDQQKMIEGIQKQIDPNWKPGDPVWI